MQSGGGQYRAAVNMAFVERALDVSEAGTDVHLFLTNNRQFIRETLGEHLSLHR